MTERLRAIAIRLLREQEVTRTNTNNIYRKRFGDRLTIALTAECAARDEEIAAINATIAMLEGVAVEPEAA